MMEAFCVLQGSWTRPRIRPRMRPNVPGCVPGCGSTSLNSGTTYLNSGTTYLDLGTTSLNSGTTYLDSGTTYLDASQDTSQTSLDASLDPDTVSIPRFYRGGLVEAPKVKASFGTHPGTWGRIQGRGDTRQERRKASIIGHRTEGLVKCAQTPLKRLGTSPQQHAASPNHDGKQRVC